MALNAANLSTALKMPRHEKGFGDVFNHAKIKNLIFAQAQIYDCIRGQGSHAAAVVQQQQSAETPICPGPATAQPTAQPPLQVSAEQW